MRRKKNSRQRGSKTHGWGSMKKHRGAGHRGGRGNAGTGKRGDAKKPEIWKNTKYFGKYGFKSISKPAKALNIAYLEQKFDTLIAKGLLKKEGDGFTIDFAELKCDKLLGAGAPSHKYLIKVEEASAKAVEKIKSKGGSVSLKQ